MDEFRCKTPDFSVPIATTSDGYASPDALTYTPITPPQSLKDVSVLESQQLSVLTAIASREGSDSNARGHRTTRQARTRSSIEEPKEINYKP